MHGFDLKPMSTGETLDATIRLYRQHFGTLLTIAVICEGVPTVLITYAAFAGGVVQAPLLYSLATLLSGLGGLVAAGTIVTVVSDAYLGEEPDLGASLRYALRKIWTLFASGAAKYLVIFFGLMLFAIPGIIVAAGYSVVGQAVVLEDMKSPVKALGRSWELTRGHKGRAVTLGIVVLILAQLPNYVAGVIGALVPSLAVGAEVAGQLFGLVLYAIIPCAFTLYYYDLRVRKEGFDLEFLSSRLDSVAEPVA